MPTTRGPAGPQGTEVPSSGAVTRAGTAIAQPTSTSLAPPGTRAGVSGGATSAVPPVPKASNAKTAGSTSAMGGRVSSDSASGERAAEKPFQALQMMKRIEVKQEGAQQKLLIGMFSLQPAYGLLQPGNSVTVNVECTAETVGRGDEVFFEVLKFVLHNLLAEGLNFPITV